MKVVIIANGGITLQLQPETPIEKVAMEEIEVRLGKGATFDLSTDDTKTLSTEVLYNFKIR